MSERLPYKLQAYGLMIRGCPDTTDESQVARAFSSNDARRLAAAWNACEGLRTEDLESLPCAFSEIAVGDWMFNGKELTAANARIAKLEALVAERDAMLGKRPCQNNRCMELNAARALLREVSNNIGSVPPFTIEKELGHRVKEYLDACDTLEGK